MLLCIAKSCSLRRIYDVHLLIFYCIYANALGRCTLIAVKRDFANDLRTTDASNLLAYKSIHAYLAATYRKAFTA